MPILLTTPYEPGSEDPGAIYTHLDILSFQWDIVNDRISMELWYGIYTPPDFEKKKKVEFNANNPHQHLIFDSPEFGNHFTDLSNYESKPGEKALSSMRRVLCQLLVDSGKVSGTIV